MQQIGLCDTMTKRIFHYIRQLVTLETMCLRFLELSFLLGKTAWVLLSAAKYGMFTYTYGIKMIKN